MSNARDIVEKVARKDITEIKKDFNKIMAGKVVKALKAKKEKIAKELVK